VYKGASPNKSECDFLGEEKNQSITKIMSSVQLQITYRETHLLRCSHTILTQSKTALSDPAREALCSELQQKILQTAGQPSIDQANESMIKHSQDPDSLKIDLASGQPSAFPEDRQYLIEVSPEQLAQIMEEIDPLRAISSIIGRENFEKFLQEHEPAHKVVDPSRQFSLDSEGKYKFSQAITASELMRSNMAAYLLGDLEATQSASALIKVMEKVVGKSWATITNDINNLNNPIISPEFSGAEKLQIYNALEKFNEIALTVGPRIAFLKQCRAGGAKIKISDAGQISLAPKEDGSLKISPLPSPLADREYFTPEELTHWNYANQLLGYSPEEKVEVMRLMLDMVKTHNDNPAERGNFDRSVSGFKDLFFNNPNQFYKVSSPGITQDQVSRFVLAKSLLLEILSAFDKPEVLDLLHRQNQQNQSIRVFNLGQIYYMNGLQISLIGEFRKLLPDEQVARESAIRQRGEARIQMFEESC
jgi:hypothetical protein